MTVIVDCDRFHGPGHELQGESGAHHHHHKDIQQHLKALRSGFTSAGGHELQGESGARGVGDGADKATAMLPEYRRYHDDEW
jgi:hypothetical protein